MQITVPMCYSYACLINTMLSRTRPGRITVSFTWMHMYMLLFIGVCYLSSLNALDPSVAMSRSFDIVKNILYAHCFVYVLSARKIS